MEGIENGARGRELAARNGGRWAVEGSETAIVEKKKKGEISFDASITISNVLGEDVPAVRLRESVVHPCYQFGGSNDVLSTGRQMAERDDATQRAAEDDASSLRRLFRGRRGT